jgi:hypothetical protein
MKKYLVLILLSVFLGCGSGESGVTVKKRGLIVPVYFEDFEKRQEVINADTEEIVIVNPFNGPGSEVDENYVNFIENLNSSKKPIGYVYTKWGNRDINQVKEDIDVWLELYPEIQGFFIDEVSNNENNVSFYKNISDYIKSKGNYFVVLNVGTMPESVYFSIADNIVVYEGNITNLPDKSCESYSDKSSIIVYGADEKRMREILLSKYCRYLYITDDNDVAPYDSLPSYFNEEIELLK